MVLLHHILAIGLIKMIIFIYNRFTHQWKCLRNHPSSRKKKKKLWVSLCIFHPCNVLFFFYYGAAMRREPTFAVVLSSPYGSPHGGRTAENRTGCRRQRTWARVRALVYLRGSRRCESTREKNRCDAVRSRFIDRFPSTDDNRGYFHYSVYVKRPCVYCVRTRSCVCLSSLRFAVFFHKILTLFVRVRTVRVIASMKAIMTVVGSFLPPSA